MQKDDTSFQRQTSLRLHQAEEKARTLKSNLEEESERARDFFRSLQQAKEKNAMLTEAVDILTDESKKHSLGNLASLGLSLVLGREEAKQMCGPYLILARRKKIAEKMNLRLGFEVFGFFSVSFLMNVF